MLILLHLIYLEKCLLLVLKKDTVEQCISHPYFEGLHDPEQELTADSTFDFSFDKDSLTKEKLRSMFMNKV